MKIMIADERYLLGCAHRRSQKKTNNAAGLSATKKFIAIAIVLCAFYVTRQLSSIDDAFHLFTFEDGLVTFSRPDSTESVALLENSARHHMSLDEEMHPTHPTSTKLLIVVPFTVQDIEILVANLDRWTQVGPACDLQSRADNRSDLWFYYSKTANALPDGFARLQATQAYQNMQQCFSHVGVIFANLSAKEDDYPVGINFMFFRLVIGATHARELRNFNALFWMEPDVQPIKPYWLDVLVRESLIDDDFWMKGSVYLGQLFDRSVGQDWMWIGHINGNALYRLNQPMFAQFLKIVMDLEPPDHFWKPFDVSIWKVLHDFPYFWHTYQRISKHFIYSDFVEHWGFGITDDSMRLSRQNPRTFMVHGRNMSSSKRVSQEKFKADMSHLNWDGVIEPKDDISVFMRSEAKDVNYGILAISSVTSHMHGASEIVVAVPDKDVPTFMKRLGHLMVHHNIKVVAEEALASEVHLMQETYTRSMADIYCRGKFIFQMRSDSVIVRKVFHKDLFWAGKPIMREESSAELNLWRTGTANALGEDMLILKHVNFRPSERVILRDVYRLVRSHVERVHGTRFRSFLKTRAGQKFCLLNYPGGDCPSAQLLERAYSDSFVVGAYLFIHMHDAASWFPLEGSRNYTRSVFVPIITRFTCEGHAWLARSLGQTHQDIQALENAMVSADCDKVKDWRIAWTDSLKSYVG
jgi:hypothetical protein